MNRLSLEAITHLRDTALMCGLNRDALLCGIDPRFLAQLNKFDQPGAQLHADLHALNNVSRLDDGSDPLHTWLVGAGAMAYPREEAQVFHQYRDHLLATDLIHSKPTNSSLSAAHVASSEGHQSVPSSSNDPYPNTPEFPRETLTIYPRLWQLETWLRRVVYVELRALLGDDWISKMRYAEEVKAAHDKLIHMPTRREGLTSYLSLPELRQIITENWQLFEHYLPPKLLWEAKIEEISQVGSRIMHFRACHRDDRQRVNQLLRDLDSGMLRFCDALNSPFPLLPQSDDPVVAHFLRLDPFPWTRVGKKNWARTGFADPDALFGMTIEIVSRPWCAKFERPAAGKSGLLYNVVIHPRQRRRLDYRALLSGTARLHRHIVYVSLDYYSGTCRLLVPAVLGADKCIEVVEAFVATVPYAISSRGEPREDGAAQVQTIAESWPDYVTGPDDLVTRLDSETCDSVFGADT